MARRLGVGEPTVLDALSVMKTGDKSLRAPLERAYNLSSDLGVIAKTLVEKGMKGIEKFSISAGGPIRVALGERAVNVDALVP